jgi:hypothetical protein
VGEHDHPGGNAAEGVQFEDSTHRFIPRRDIAEIGSYPGERIGPRPGFPALGAVSMLDIRESQGGLLRGPKETVKARFRKAQAMIPFRFTR